MVQNVEGFRPELQPGSLPEAERFDRRDIPLAEAGANKHIAAGVSESPWRHLFRSKECFGVEPARQRALARR